MVKKIILLIVAVLFVTISVFAQNMQVSGTVTSTDGKPIAGATVVVEGTNVGTSTDSNGKYTLSAPSNGLLTFSFIGYVDTSIAINNKTVVNAALSEDTANIDEVVVVGYGSGRKVGSIIGSVDQVKSDKLQERPTSNVMDALQGQVAGLQIFSTSGELDATSAIRLHGMGSISAGNEPLILLDGAPITTGTLMAMNSNDIASVSVLKDASATSIYGSRAANGVVYVTTKKGSRGQENAVVTLRTQYSLSSPVQSRMKRMSTDQLLTFAGDTFAAYNGFEYGDPTIYPSATWDQIFGPGASSIFGDATMSQAWRQYVRDFYFGIDENVNVNWYDEILKKNAPLYQVDLSVAGGTQKTSYFVSSNYTDQQGILPGSTNKRYTFRANVDSQVKKWLKIGLNLGIGYQKSENASTSDTAGDLYTSNPLFAAFLIPSYQAAQDENGNDLDFLDFYGTENPKYENKWYKMYGNRLQLNGSTYVEIKPYKDVTIRSQLSANAFDYRSTSSSSPNWPTESGVRGTGSAHESFQRNYDWTWTNTVEYKHTFAEKHNVAAILGHESIYGYSNMWGIGTKGQSYEELLNIGAGTEITALPTYSVGEYAYNSAFFRAEYNYAEKYFVDASVRYDACSRFGIENRGAIFWSAGAMWNLKKEDWLKDVKAVSNLAVKASYGTQGNSGIGNYSQYQVAAPSKYPYNGSPAFGLSGIPNPTLAWEKQSTLTIGAQVELWKKLSVELDWYRRKTTDLLMPQPLAPSAGYSSITNNVGAMLNSGVDLTINYNIFQNKDWYVSAYANFNYNKNQITQLWEKGLEKSAMADMLYYVVGKPYGSFYAQEWRGVNPETGAPQWTAADGGVTENFDEAVEVDLNKSIMPPFSGGFGFNVSWKGIGLTADFAWAAGNYMVNNNRYFFANPYYSLGYGQITEALDYWKQPGDKTEYPALWHDVQFDSHLIEDASFLRLKNLQLSYTLPQSVLKGNRVISGFKVYVGARNLLTATKYKGLDPEVAGGVTPFDTDIYPNTRQWTFGCEFKF